MPIHTAFSVIMVAASSMPMKGTRGAALSVLLTELKRIGPHITVGDLQDVAIQNGIKVTDDLLLKLAQACMKLSTIGQHNVRYSGGSAHCIRETCVICVALH